MTAANPHAYVYFFKRACVAGGLKPTMVTSIPRQWIRGGNFWKQTGVYVYVCIHVCVCMYVYQQRMGFNS